MEEELRIREPPQPFMGEPEPVPPPTTPLEEVVTGSDGVARRVIDLNVRKQQRLAKEAAQANADSPYLQEKRFRAFRTAETAAQNAVVRDASLLDPPAVVEDREYNLDEVSGPNARFKLRFVGWQGRSVSTYPLEPGLLNVVKLRPSNRHRRPVYRGGPRRPGK
jgi:hypothetical protein